MEICNEISNAPSRTITGNQFDSLESGDILLSRTLSSQDGSSAGSSGGSSDTSSSTGSILLTMLTKGYFKHSGIVDRTIDDKDTDFYCSKVVYRCWLSQGYDLEYHTKWYARGLVVTPQDLYDDDDTYYLFEDLPK